MSVSAAQRQTELHLNRLYAFLCHTPQYFNTVCGDIITLSSRLQVNKDRLLWTKDKSDLFSSTTGTNILETVTHHFVDHLHLIHAHYLLTNTQATWSDWRRVYFTEIRGFDWLDLNLRREDSPNKTPGYIKPYERCVRPEFINLRKSRTLKERSESPNFDYRGRSSN